MSATIDWGGPYVAIATFCDRVLLEADGTVSLIRVIDSVTVTVAGEDPPDAMPPSQLDLVLALQLRCGHARSRDDIHLELEEPSGQSQIVSRMPVTFDGSHSGVQFTISVAFVVKQEGVHWVAVRLRKADTLLTRVPLRVVYQPIQHQPQSG